MAKNKKRPAKKKAAKAKAKAKAKTAVKKAAKKPATRKAAKKTARKVAKKPATRKVAKKITKKTAKKRAAAAPKAVQKKPVVTTVPPVSSKPSAPALDKKSVKLFVDEDPQKPVLSQPTGSPMPKDSDLDEELGEEEVDITVEADEDVEEELTLDGEDEDANFPEKREGLLDDADDYHTH
jgi:hypothetical protein